MRATSPEPLMRRSDRKGGARAGSPSQHVLLVEDDDEMRRMLAYILTRDGFRVTEARDGLEALDYLGSWILEDRSEHTFDLLLTDQRMPGFPGLDVIDAARASGTPLPAILITAFSDGETREHARMLGATTVLDKPFEASALLALARRVARPRSA